MAEVVIGLESILALQEKTESTWVPTFLFPSTWEKTVGGTDLKSLERYLYNVGGEDKIVHKFDFITILDATENFSEANKISSCSYDSVYKGRLQNGQDITVTQYSKASTYKLCMNEASILVKVEHQNLIQLLGYCIHGTEVYLIYDFPLNATMADMIYDPRCNLLDWNKRYKIILDIARALVYLHRHAPIRIIHLDVKPANILIDESYNPRLSGFGGAVTTSETDCVSLDNVFGTMGYIAPEYHRTLRCSTKADVYSFGVLIFETVTGKTIQNLLSLALDKHLGFADYIHKNWLEGTLSDIIDPQIDADSVSMTKFVEIGLLCVQGLAADRPTMEEVIGMLLGTSSLTFHVSEMRERMMFNGVTTYLYNMKVKGRW
ncbi:putative protein kinase RLK-Pelle-DLSV family [Helianthus annuus]|nr:putative protein kinase RLK-Pelle-DLSV family [Helianthus annuus]